MKNLTKEINGVVYELKNARKTWPYSYCKKCVGYDNELCVLLGYECLGGKFMKKYWAKKVEK